MAKIAIVGASGKLGGATLTALLKHELAPASDIIALTSSTAGSETWERLAATGVEVRHARFEDSATFEEALTGVSTLFLVSTPAIALDFGVPMDFDGTITTTAFSSSTEGSQSRHAGGRERHHKTAIDAAVKAGVKRIVYSSLAFGYSPSTVGPGDSSFAGVMRAHLRTEAYLKEYAKGKHGVEITILREGLYSESWPLYLGYFDVENAHGGRAVIPLAADGKVCWTAIHDLGVASALVLVDSSSEFTGRTVYLSTRSATAMTVGEIAELVGNAIGKDIAVQSVGRKDHERYYVDTRGKPQPAVEWWASSYEALDAGETCIDDPVLEMLLERVGLEPIPVEETVAAMLKGQED
ncbi:hypothetical protein F4777DRAFT_401208 [Nemania sp. FL0916]|nr:hypothetical protein F4777DRAFT_401208 [Nemania sp. FL0916]